MDPVIVGIFGVVFLLIFIFLGVPIPVTFAILGFVGFLLMSGWNPAWQVIRTIPFSRLGIGSFHMSVIPLFTLLGIVLFECGVGEEIYSAMRNWMGRIRGGLAASTSAACAFLGTMTGSGWAAAGLMSRLAYPEMRKSGYQPELALAVCASSSTVAMMIPPSIVLVIYAVLAEQSIAECLLAGFIPGFLSMGIYMVMILIRAQLNPSLGPPQPSATWRVRFISLRYLVPAVIMMLTIIGGIYFGVFTATEAAGIGALVAFITVIAMRRLTWIRFKNIVTETIRLNIMILLILLTALALYTPFLTATGLPMAFSKLALVFPSPFVTIAIMITIMFLMGMFVGSPLIYVTVPIFAPVVESLGYSVVWFGIVMIKMIEVGAITPPVCMTVFISQGIIGEVPMGKAYRAVWWFVLCDMITLALLIAFPQIALFLPNAMRGG